MRKRSEDWLQGKIPTSTHICEKDLPCVIDLAKKSSRSSGTGGGRIHMHELGHTRQPTSIGYGPKAGLQSQNVGVSYGP